MYLTAHRVRTADGDLGINGALYQGGEFDGSAQSLSAVAQGEHGPRIGQRTDVRPGGNSVDAFLDVVMPDDVGRGELERFLHRGSLHLRGDRAELLETTAGMRFKCNPGLEGEASELLAGLIDAVLGITRDEQTSHGDTLNIEVRNDGAVWTFSLEQQAVQAVRERFPTAKVAPKLSVPFQTADAFRRAYGRLYPTVLELLTTKTINEFEGLTVRFHRGDQTLWQWPV